MIDFRKFGPPQAKILRKYQRNLGNAYFFFAFGVPILEDLRKSQEKFELRKNFASGNFGHGTKKNYTLYRGGIFKYRSDHMNLLIFREVTTLYTQIWRNLRVNSPFG